MTTKQFKESRTGTFNLNFIKYIALMASEEEIIDIVNNNLPVTIKLEEGTYTVRWDDLVSDALIEIADLKEKNQDIEMPEEISKLLKSL